MVCNNLLLLSFTKNNKDIIVTGIKDNNENYVQVTPMSVTLKAAFTYQGIDIRLHHELHSRASEVCVVMTPFNKK